MELRKAIGAAVLLLILAAIACSAMDEDYRTGSARDVIHRAILWVSCEGVLIPIAVVSGVLGLWVAIDLIRDCALWVLGQGQ